MKNPIIPMGAITGSMSAEEIKTMMERYAEAGIEQYLFYARGGCDVEFMSEEWLDICENITRECERLGIDLWLYDEYDCPAGTCHRTILRDYPDFRCKGIKVTDGKCEIVHDTGYIPMSDLLNPACVTEFMNRTYEKLYDRLGKWFGTVIKGVFSDEPSLGCMLEKVVRTHPYTEGIEDEYREKYGGDLFELIARDDLTCLENYYELLADRLRRVYFDRVRAWCDEKGVLFTGHLLEEGNMRNAVVSNGNAIKLLRGFSLPGMDEIFGKIGIKEESEWITLATVQAARSENGALAELGAFGPCDQPLGRYLQMIRLAALFGVDHYVCAVSGADQKGSLVKTDWLHPTNYTQPHFACYGEFGRLAKEAARLASKKTAAEVAIEYPVKAAAREMSREANTVDPALNALIEKLIINQYQWVFVDENDETPAGALRVNYLTSYEEIASKVTPAARVTDENGLIPEELFVRRYADGTVAVLDMRDEGGERKLLVNGMPVTLPARGMYVSEIPFEIYAPVLSAYPEMTLSLDRPVIKRCAFTQDRLTYSFDVDSAVNARLYIRQLANDAKVTLDGKEMTAALPCAGLTPGIKELYSQTEDFTLDAGAHSVSVSAYAGKSDAFLPCVLVAFDAQNAVVRAGERLEEKYRGFAGIASYEFDLTVPESDEKLFIEVPARELCLKAYIDGCKVGTRVIAPYVFPVPENGKTVRVRLEQYTTIGPVFGNRDEVLPDTPKGRILYKYFPGKYERLGIESVRIVKKA